MQQIPGTCGTLLEDLGAHMAAFASIRNMSTGVLLTVVTKI